ncbi:hypothetical protein [Nakamurella panacisegetis]|nr:hypothetical protein [Nakamurella panacisegetis]
MTEPDLLHAAVDELYASPMPEFTARRKALAAAARQAGHRDVATAIAALRKPTLSADTLNRLVRAAPDEVDELLELGAGLRRAEQELDGPALRELSGRRKALVADLTRLAFDITGQPNPSPSIRDEVVATLNAALADEQVADRLISGALVTQARWDGFGSTSLPELAAVLPLRRPRTPPATPLAAPRSTTEHVARPTEPTPKRRPADDRGTRRTDAASERKAAQDKAAEDRARREREQRMAQAQREADEADAEAAHAAADVAAIDRRIDELTAEITEQRRRLAQAQRRSRSADVRRRAAQLALTRTGGGRPG